MASTSIIDAAVGVFGRTAALKGVTWDDTRDNRFTPLDTPQLWDGGAVSRDELPPASHQLLKAIADVIGTADTVVDITTLWWSTHDGFPKGLFQEAISHGFKRINDRGAKPLIRIMIGVPTFFVVSVSDLNKWIQDTLRLTMKPSDFRGEIHIATNHTSNTPPSWNHSKIIAGDGRAIVGGHNLWHGDYLDFAPVYDVSGLIEGPAANSAHRFCNKLWTEPFDVVRWGPGDTYQHIARHSAPAANLPSMTRRGSVRALALGRLGSGIVTRSLESNASVVARIVALCRAKSHIRISQQSLGATSALPILQPEKVVCRVDPVTCIALAAALAAGVTVDVVVSNDRNNYAGNAEESLHHIALMYWALRTGEHRVFGRDMTDQWAILSDQLTDAPELLSRFTPTDMRQTWAELKGRLNFATLQLRDDGIASWRDPKSTRTEVIGNHAKVYIVDDTNFYFGSDNMYKSASIPGLQEFGYLVEDQAETRRFLSHYWEPLWKRSRSKLMRPWPYFTQP